MKTSLGFRINATTVLIAVSLMLAFSSEPSSPHVIFEEVDVNYDTFAQQHNLMSEDTAYDEQMAWEEAIPSEYGESLLADIYE